MGSLLCGPMGHGAAEALRLSLPPVQDAVPLAFGVEQGVFTAHGLEVELIGIMKNRDRNAALLSGNLDGLIGDITSAAILLNAQVRIAVTSTAFEIVDDSRGLIILTHQYSGIKTLQELVAAADAKRPPLAIVRRTDMEFETDRLLKSLGLRLDKKALYSDWVDFEKLMQAAGLIAAGSNNITAAVLPEPMAILAEIVAAGRELPVKTITLADYRENDLLPSILIFRRQVLEERPHEIAKFYEAYKEAIKLLNATPYETLVETVLIVALRLFYPNLKREELKLPQGFEEKFHVPQFPQPRILEREEFLTVVDWALLNEYITNPIAYEEAVDSSFLG